MKSAVIRARLEESTKKKAESILNELGITSSQAINMLYHQIILCKGLPFESRLPGATTLNAIEEKEGTICHGTPEQLFDDLGI